MKRPRLTYSNVVASLALFVALGGTSYAITKLPRDSVGSIQVRDGSLQGRDLASDARVAGPRGPRGGQGPASPAGERGQPGQAGERGPSDVVFAPPAPNVTLTGTNQWIEVRRIDGVTPGVWNIRFDANGYLDVPGPVYAFCRLLVNGDVKAADGLVVGFDARAVQDAGLSMDTIVSQATGPFNVKAECSQNSAQGVGILRAQLLATQVGRATIVP